MQVLYALESPKPVDFAQFLANETERNGPAPPSHHQSLRLPLSLYLPTPRPKRSGHLCNGPGSLSRVVRRIFALHALYSAAALSFSELLAASLALQYSLFFSRHSSNVGTAWLYDDFDLVLRRSGGNSSCCVIIPRKQVGRLNLHASPH